MLGEKRNLSLFGSQPAQEEKQVKHITVDRDGEKKDIPLYFGPDWPVVNGTGDTVPSPSDGLPSCQAEGTAEKAEEAAPVEPTPQDTPASTADSSPDADVQYPDDSPRRTLASNTVVANRTHALFFAPEGDSRDFNSVLKEVQEYISGKYSSLITDGGDEDAKSQIKRYITKYVQDQRIAVKGYSADGLVDALYTEMAEFGLLTKYIFGTGIEEININSWRDIEVLYSNGQMVKLDEHFDSPSHAINVIRRMLHVSGMVLDNASPAVLGHLSKNIRIAVLKTPLVDEDVGVTASIRIVNPQNMQKDDFVRGGTATGDMLDFLSACLRYGVSVCVAGATGSGKTTVAGWLLTTIPDNKRVFTIENGSRELDLVREKDGKVCNSVIHTLTRESENAKQNIDQDTAPDGTVLDQDYYAFDRIVSATSRDGVEMDTYGIGWEVLPSSTEDETGRHATILMTIHSLKGEFNFIGAKVKLTLNGLYRDNCLEELVVPGRWSCTFTMPETDPGRLCTVNEPIEIEGKNAVLTTLYISPLSLTCEIKKGTDDLKETVEPIYSDDGKESIAPEVTLQSGETIGAADWLFLITNYADKRGRYCFQMDEILDPETVSSVSAFGETFSVE